MLDVTRGRCSGHGVYGGSMKKVLLLAGSFALACSLMFAAAHAEHHYDKVGGVHGIMEYGVKAPNGKISAMRKAGGPENEKDWKSSEHAAGMIGESMNLVLMGGRVKDDIWKQGAIDSLTGAKALVAASKSMDTAAWMKATGKMGQGCRGCHKKHKPKKGAKGGKA